MKKRLFCIVLALIMLCTILPVVPLTVDAATELSVTPNPKVEYGYTSETPAGTIRYIAQNRGSEYFSWNYWPTNSFGGYTGGPEIECGTACISMALSYVGVNRTPKALLEATNGYTGSMWGRQGDATSTAITISQSGISLAMDNYINGNGKYSPLCVYIKPFSATSDMHWVLLVGKLGDNKYLALNPWHTSGTDGTFAIHINGTTASYNGTTNPITSVNQWYNANAVINSDPAPVISNVTVNDINSTGYTVTCKVTDNGEISSVLFPSWSDNNGQDDLSSDWNTANSTYGGKKNGDTYSFRVSTADHKNDHGKYFTHIYATDSLGNCSVYHADPIIVPERTEYSVIYHDASGAVWKSAVGSDNEAYTLSGEYPKRGGHYFCGWAYAPNASDYNVRPNESISLSGNIHLYPVYVSFSKAVSGEIVFIYNINDFTEPGYDIQSAEETTTSYIDNSYWTEWSDYTTDYIGASDKVQVRTTALYRYYYYLCPGCGRHEPFYGKSDCGAQIPSSSCYVGWFTTPYSQSNPQTFSYTTRKRYTTSLGDGQIWIFSTGNLNDTAIGTEDSDSSGTVISTGYSSRSYVEKLIAVYNTRQGYVIKQIPATLTSIELSAYPNKLTYEQAEVLDLAGMIITAVYSDGTTKTITDGYQIYGYNADAIGTQNITVDYEGLSTNFIVTVNKKAEEIKPDTSQIVVESKEALPGETITVTIAVKNNPGIASMKLKVKYGTLITLTNITYNAEIGGQFQQPQTMNSPVVLNWFNGASNSYGDWIYATLTFVVSETAEAGDCVDISVTYDENDLYNIAEENVEFAIVNGKIEISHYLPGDINNDGMVNNRDLTRLFQYLSYWDVEVNEAALDVNGDGNVNNRDLTRLFQYLSSWDVEIH